MTAKLLPSLPTNLAPSRSYCRKSIRNERGGNHRIDMVNEKEVENLSSDNQDGLIPSTRQDILTMLDSLSKHGTSYKENTFGRFHHCNRFGPTGHCAVCLPFDSPFILCHPRDRGRVWLSSDRATWSSHHYFGNLAFYWHKAILLYQPMEKKHEDSRQKEEIDRKIASQFGLDPD